MGTNTHHKPKHAAPWTIISEDNAGTFAFSYQPKHRKAAIMDGFRPVGSVR